MAPKIQRYNVALTSDQIDELLDGAALARARGMSRAELATLDSAVAAMVAAREADPTPEPPRQATDLGHTPAWHPHAASTTLRRWTCACGMAVLDNYGYVYGPATTAVCPLRPAPDRPTCEPCPPADAASAVIK